MNAYYSSPEFEAKYTYTGNDLGAVWSPNQTQFRLWAPTADAVTVNLYQSGAAGTDDLLEQLMPDWKERKEKLEKNFKDGV